MAVTSPFPDPRQSENQPEKDRGIKAVKHIFALALALTFATGFGLTVAASHQVADHQLAASHQSLYAAQET